MLYSLVIAFLKRSKVGFFVFFFVFFFFEQLFLITWLQSPSTVILESKKIKPVTISIVSASVCHEVIGLDASILAFFFFFNLFTFLIEV